MARKIYTQEQFEKILNEEINKFYERQEEHERQARLYRRIDALEERVYKLEHNGESEHVKCECTTRSAY